MWLSCVAVELLSLVLVSVLWGCTNPFLKKGTEGIENVQHNNNRVSQLLAEVKFLFLNIKVNPVICFLFAVECACLKWLRFLKKNISLKWLPCVAPHSIWSHFSWTRVALWSTIIPFPPQVRHISKLTTSLSSKGDNYLLTVDIWTCDIMKSTCG